ncbi:tape measure protein [Methylorubrum aminovorans]|nr:tape measure protein [Methylorubrum aminovorans]
MARVGQSIRLGIAGAIAGISLGGLNNLIDTFTKVQNSLKVTGLQGENLSATFNQIYAIAQKQGAPLETLSGLYSRAAQTQKELNASSADLITFTNSVATALRAGGVGAVQADQALTQLGQALGSGKVQWEDLESVVDSAPTILQAAAAGIKEAGGSVGQLIQLVKDGKVSSEALFRAINAGLPAVQALANRTDETSSQGMARLNNAAVKLAGTLAEATGASQLAANALGSVATAVESLTDKIPGAIKALSEYFQQLSKAPYFQSLVQSIAATEGGDTPSEAVVPGLKRSSRPAAAGTGPRRVEGLDLLRDAMKARGEILDAAAKKDKKAADAADSRVSRVFDADAKALAPKQISLADYKVPGDKDKKGGGGAKSKENDLQRETAAITKRTGALQSELTTIGQSAGVVAEAEAKFRLLEAAKKANIAVTPALMDDINKTAAAFGVATQAVEDAERAHRRAAEAQRYFGDAATDALTDLAIEGRSATEVFENLTKSILKAATQAALMGTGPLAGLFGSPANSNGSGGGILGSLLSGLNPTGRAGGGPVKAGTPYTVGESGRETFLPTSPGRIIPNRKMGGGNVQVIDQRSMTAPPIETRRGPGGNPQIVVRDAYNSMQGEARRRGQRGPGYGVG